MTVNMAIMDPEGFNKAFAAQKPGKQIELPTEGPLAMAS